MRFHFEQAIELARTTLFAFHENPANLETLHRGWSNFRLIRHDGGIRQGNRTWVEVTMAGILPVVLGFEHTLYEPPRRFGEELIHGPFRKLSHVHEFEEVNSTTIVRDFLDVELPWIYGGEAAMTRLVAPILNRIFKQRGASLANLAKNNAIDPLAKQHQA